MSSPRDNKEKKIEEVKAQRGLNESQLDILKQFIAPVRKAQEVPFEELLESAGFDIQVVLGSKEMDVVIKKFFLHRAMREEGEDFAKTLDKNLPSGVSEDVKKSLKNINNFCFDNEVEFLVEGYGLHAHLQKRTTSQHYLWAVTRLSPFKNQDKPMLQMTAEEKDTAKRMAEDMQSEAKKMIAASCVFLGKSELLDSAIRAGDVLEVQELLKNKANLHAAIDKFGISPLHLAVYEGYDAIVKALLDAKANVNAAKTDGDTPLHAAAFYGHDAIVKSLLDAKADLNAAVYSDGVTPLYVAAQNGHAVIVKALLDAKANVNAAATEGTTPLYMAAQNGHAVIVKTLLDAKANVNAAETDGATPLYMAAQEGHVAIVKALLDAKADCTAARKSGDTPLVVAIYQGHDEIAQLIQAEMEKQKSSEFKPSMK